MVRWLVAFAITQAVETPIYVRAQPGVPWPRRIAVAFGASTITHPLVWLAPRDAFESWVGYVLVAEAFAIVVEALWLRAFGVARAGWWSLFANAASVAIGLALRAATGSV
ncbi:MAG TPA: hypothetical protein VG755_25585 [Nannocystaceae bacterium]|nr:hypothetical protein [Nannocystaceae bacterium]